MQLQLGFRPDGLRVSVLGSGSAGNCLVIESGGRRLLVDAGFSCREIERRLARLGLAVRGFSGLVLTHEHGDHCRGARVFAKRYRVPVFATAGTLGGVRLAGNGITTGVLAAGKRARVGPFAVEPFGVPHDAREPIGLVIEDAAGHRLGLVTDLGGVSRVAWRRLKELDVLILETNHDLEMLRNGPYPWHLKQRIASPTGHLSNRDAAAGLAALTGERLKWVVLYHLSRTNNLPALAAEAVLGALDREGSDARIWISEQWNPSPWLHVRGHEAWEGEPVLPPLPDAARPRREASLADR